MIGKIVRLILVVAVAFGCAWSTAQEVEAPSKKPTLSKEEQEAKAKAREKNRQAKAKHDAELKAKAVDINHASKAELMKTLAISDAFAAAIIAKRPYKSKAELVSKHAIPQSTYQGIHSLVVAK